ncbi:hypothetical protein ACNPKZ_17380 [Shewanella algae]|uniref:hypothetical protein n=1 Tax=Shewanella TaxID=22 RepID=UPI000F42556C|nr:MULTISPECIES: hypothetical protein [Shewanella]AYV11407.1 hypothetical protein EEY24_00085 [Shewanella algae]
MFTGFSPTIFSFFAIFTVLFLYEGILELIANKPMPPDKVMYLLMLGFIYCLFRLQSVNAVPSRIRQSSTLLACIGFLLVGFWYTYDYIHPSSIVVVTLSPFEKWCCVLFVLFAVLITWKSDNTWRLDGVPNKSGLSFGVEKSGTMEIIKLHFSGTEQNVIHGLNGLAGYCHLVNENRMIELRSPLLSNPRYVKAITWKLESIKDVDLQWSISTTPYAASTLNRLCYALLFSIKTLKFNSNFWKVAQQDWKVMTINSKQ